MNKTNVSRRSFLSRTAMASVGVVVLPSLLSLSPNNKLNIAAIGVGNRGGHNLRVVAKTNNIVALCDVDDFFLQKAGADFPQAQKFVDFRKMFDQMSKEIDAVVISTPDHTHFAATMIAMQLGKHVYVEKPLAHNIWQLRTLKKAANHYGIISQMGNQGHTTEGIRLIKEWYDTDVLGEVKEVHAWRGENTFKPGYYFTKPESFPAPKQNIPSNLNWDLWLGPAANRPFNSVYAPKSWRGFYDFGLGQLGDWACHTMDAPYWALDLGAPHKVQAEIPEEGFNHQSFMPDASTVTFSFKKRGAKPPVKLVWHEEGYKKPNIEIMPEWGIKELNSGGGMLMIGSKKTLMTGARPEKPRLLVSDEAWAEFLKNAPEKTIPRVGHNQPHNEWLNAIKNNTQPGSNFDYATGLTEMALVGVMAQRFGGLIKYDEANMKIKNRPELNQYIKESARDGWSFGEDLWT